MPKLKFVEKNPRLKKDLIIELDTKPDLENKSNKSVKKEAEIKQNGIKKTFKAKNGKCF